MMAAYTSGCPDLDKRILEDSSGGLSGGVIGISADGDVGLVLSLQVAVQHLQTSGSPDIAPATAHVVTTHPVTHVLSLLKAVLHSARVDRLQRAALLKHVLISRVYGPDELWAVIAEMMDDAVPFQRLQSGTLGGPPGPKTMDELSGEGRSGQDQTSKKSPPRVVIITEMDHHFKWMRLQGYGLRLQEMYGQLMRRLRALAAPKFPLSLDSSAADDRPLVLVLNGTMVRWTADGSAADEPEDNSSEKQAAQSEGGSWERALALLCQQQDRPARERQRLVRLACMETIKAQGIEPCYKGLMDYLCSLHVCFTSIPPDAAATLLGACVALPEDVSYDASLWVATVEADERDMCDARDERTGLVLFSHGVVRDALKADKT